LSLPILPNVGSRDDEAPPELATKGTYAFVSLGCPKNLVDSEKMLGTLALDGYTLAEEPAGTDFVIVNTCGFIESSRAESKAVIREMLDLKQAGKTKGVIVAGCLPERLGPALLEEIPEIDHILGVFSREEITKIADRMIGGVREQRSLFRPAPIKAMNDQARLRITPRHFAYLKISEGCDRTCTFCAIPKMRGKHLTKPIEMVVEEARELARDGVRELILVAQDTTYYGLDLYGRVRLTELLQELEQVEGIEWIRLMYLYPINFTDGLIDVIATSRKIIPYLDMPLQHINDAVLKRMQRRVRRADIDELLGKLRQQIPNLVMRTTFVVGFPGETDEQFEELYEFVKQQEFQRVGVFTYSPEPGTPAMKLDGHMDESIKQTRYQRLMELQQGIAFKFTDSMIGYELDAFVDSEVSEGVWQGRCYFDAPEIDASVMIHGENLQPGDMVPVVLESRRDYDLVGTAVDAPIPPKLATVASAGSSLPIV
jgi:ribosomal protein S12 methylthiotransferase